MAKDIENSSGEDSASAPPPAGNAKAGTSELPAVESPSISPGREASAEPEIEPIAPGLAMVPAQDAPDEANKISRFAFALNERHKRHAMLAASVAFAACIGAVIGALALGGAAPPAPKNTAALHERAAMQKSILHLNKEIASLKANLAAANKAAHSQVAKNTDRITEKLNEHAERAASPETTGSIPTPLPRPVAAAPVRPPVLGDWAIRDAHNGYVYVQGHGDIYQIVPGANLPGIGPVQSITQQDGRWVVLTPRGIIVSMRDRHFFE